MIKLLFPFVWCAFATCIASAEPATAPAIVILEGEAEIPKKQAFEQEMELTEAPEGCDTVLEFTAWYKAGKPAGFYSTLRVFWDGEEQWDALERPMQVIWGEGRVSEIRGENGWLVAIVTSPEDVRRADSPYQIRDEELEMTRYRFRLPASSSGAHKVKILNNLADPKDQYFSTLVLQDVKIRFIAR